MLTFDAHVHLYDCYDLKNALQAAMNNLQNHRQSGSMACCLTERTECRYFENFQHYSAELEDDWHVEVNLDPFTHRLTQKSTGTALFLFAGRQINTSEKLEVAALCCSPDIPDGLPIREVLHSIIKQKGLPVLSWAFGKWLFQRAKTVHKILDEFHERVVLCDSSLRPYGWPPDPLLYGRKLGIPLIAGTDPLPCPAEATLIGTYATAMDIELNETHPAATMRENLLSRDTNKRVLGRRTNWFSTLCRQRTYQRTGCST